MCSLLLLHKNIRVILKLNQWYLLVLLLDINRMTTASVHRNKYIEYPNNVYYIVSTKRKIIRIDQHKKINIKLK